jgi:hypothetical protein
MWPNSVNEEKYEVVLIRTQAEAPILLVFLAETVIRLAWLAWVVPASGTGMYGATETGYAGYFEW